MNRPLVGGFPTRRMAAVFVVTAVLASVPLRTSRHRASKEYRAEMIKTHLPLILARAAERARSGQVVPEGVGL